MVVSSPRFVNPQLTLWDLEDPRIRHSAQTRNLCGDFFEQATAALTGAVRHRTDSTADVCPDLSWNGSAFFESKSIGRTACSIVYLRRIANDDRFRKRYPERPLYYWLWHHTAKATEATTKAELRLDLAMTLCHCIVLPFTVIRDYVRKCPLKTLNQVLHDKHAGKTGYNTRTYGRGWNVRLTKFAELCTTEIQHPGLRIGGVVTQPFVIKTVSGVERFLLD